MGAFVGKGVLDGIVSVGAASLLFPLPFPKFVASNVDLSVF